MCNLCEENEVAHEYVLCDGSILYICEVCGRIIHGIEFKPIIDSRLFHVIMILDYIDMVRND